VICEFLTSFIYTGDKNIYECVILCSGYRSGSTIHPSHLKVEMQTLTLSKKSENIIRETIRFVQGSVSNGY
jgi:hypothetical protein